MKYELTEIHPVRSLLFDLDGTLIDSYRGVASCLATAFRAAGKTMPSADLRTLLGPPMRIIAKRIDPTLTEEELAQIEKTFRSEYDSQGWRETVLFEGVALTLQEIQHAGARMFIVTNKPRIPTIKILEHLGMMDLFQEIVTRDSRTPGYSGKSEMLSELLLHHRLPPESTMMVGDTAEDEEAAVANHLEFIYATYGYGSIGTARRTIAYFSELWSVLSKESAERV